MDLADFVWFSYIVWLFLCFCQYQTRDSPYFRTCSALPTFDLLIQCVEFQNMYMPTRNRFQLLATKIDIFHAVRKRIIDETQKTYIVMNSKQDRESSKFIV